MPSVSESKTISILSSSPGNPFFVASLTLKYLAALLAPTLDLGVRFLRIAFWAPEVVLTLLFFFGEPLEEVGLVAGEDCAADAVLFGVPTILNCDEITITA